MEAASTSETSVDIQLRTRQYIPEDSEFHTRRRENLKSHKFVDDGGSKCLWNVGQHSIKNKQYIPEDSEFHTRRRENLKSQKFVDDGRQ
jgi:hypothetical protein